ncbi:MAG: prepilin-type N-terminal cleavage/methylation domain-containing protein [Kiritimatiellae bacterium]|nr:prepilin-type N-terminal cleavage/methylation domain-containing protein [Kiritimatiellia bacterium]MDW8459491.1 prepilin-type N-terminal cleavage/methylation domain-containing protein [Verrucomicrobiota bacterium]
MRRTGFRTLPRGRSGFTLVELLVALAVAAVAIAIVWQSFAAITRAWRRSMQVADNVRHGDFVIDQLVSALRSAAYFPLRPDRYGFWLENRGDRDVVSWVTSGTAFIPPDSPLALGLRRIMVGIEPNEDGVEAFTVRAFPHLAESLEPRDAEAWSVSSRVQGLDVRIWNPEEERWEDEWEDTNKIPGLVEVTLYMTPLERYEPPMKIARLVQIPLGPVTLGTTPVATGQPGAEGGDPDARQDAGGQPQQNANSSREEPRERTRITSGR